MSGGIVEQIIQAGRGLGYGTERDPRKRLASGSVADIPATSTTSRPTSTVGEMVRRLLTVDALPKEGREDIPQLTGADARGGLLMPWDDQAIDPNRSSFWGDAARSVQSGVTLPRDVYEGTAKLSDDDTLARVYETTGLAMGGGIMGTAGKGGTTIGSGPVMADRLMGLNRKYNAPTEAAPALTDGRISQRLPTSKQNLEDPIGQDLRINVDTLRRTPEMMENSGRMLDQILPRNMAGAPTEEKFGAAQALMVNNLKHLYNQAPTELVERAPKWYPGSNVIVRNLAQELGIPVESAAGMAAALSPQKDWFQNVSLAQRIGRTLAEDPRVDQRMIDALGGASSGMAGHTEQLARQLGMRVSDLPTDDAGRAAWAHDLATRDRSFSSWNPEGDDLGPVLTGAGNRAQVTHQALNATGKAVDSFRSGGDTSIISPLMGDKHKVRNFYNDIIAPYAKYDDWTNDTHNIAGSLYRPLSSSDTLTQQGLGDGAASAMTGAQGLYGLYADAGRQAAREVGMDDPSGMQSLVWEQIRSRMPAKFKGVKSNKAAVDAVWERYRNGEISDADARAEIDNFIESKSPMKAPGWMR